jgi:hypothetical protein
VLSSVQTAEREREREKEEGGERVTTARTHTLHMKIKHAHATQHAHAHKTTKRSGEAERSGEEGLRVSPTTIHTARLRAQESRAQRLGQAQRRSGFRGLPGNDTPQYAHAQNKSSAVEKRHPSDFNAPQHATKRERERLVFFCATAFLSLTRFPSSCACRSCHGL